MTFNSSRLKVINGWNNGIIVEHAKGKSFQKR